MCGHSCPILDRPSALRSAGQRQSSRSSSAVRAELEGPHALAVRAHRRQVVAHLPLDAALRRGTVYVSAAWRRTLACSAQLCAGSSARLWCTGGRACYFKSPQCAATACGAGSARWEGRRGDGRTKPAHVDGPQARHTHHCTVARDPAPMGAAPLQRCPQPSSRPRPCQPAQRRAARLDQAHRQPGLRPHEQRVRQPRGAAAGGALLDAPHAAERLAPCVPPLSAHARAALPASARLHTPRARGLAVGRGMPCPSHSRVSASRA